MVFSRSYGKIFAAVEAVEGAREKIFTCSSMANARANVRAIVSKMEEENTLAHM